MTLTAQSSEIDDFAGRPRYSCPKCKSENVRLALLPYLPEHTVCGFLGYLFDGDTVDVWMTVSATCRACNHEDEPYRFRHMPRGRPTAKKRPTPPYRSYVYTCPVCGDADDIMCYAVNPTKLALRLLRNARKRNRRIHNRGLATRSHVLQLDGVRRRRTDGFEISDGAARISERVCICNAPGSLKLIFGVCGISHAAATIYLHNA